MEINIYWKDLSKDGQETMEENGFVPTEEQISEEEPIGVIDTEERQ